MLNIKITKICLNVAAALILPAAISAQQAEEPPAKPSPTMESHIGGLSGRSAPGGDLYYRYCWGCHGSLAQIGAKLNRGVLAGNVCTRNDPRTDVTGVDQSRAGLNGVVAFTIGSGRSGTLDMATGAWTFTR